ncbi:MAG: ferritin [Candidatus Omnitrophica bacterium]|nr:ferritin [Candidatus Omnitrophota bacterium]MCM8825807.1 ferritin [Candidatus Omnitrophota bacterium]
MEKNLHKAMNEQIRNELYSAYLYLGMSAYCEEKNLPGIAKWMRIQAKEEVGHAMKFFDFMVDVGAKIELLEIDKPPADFSSITEIFEKTLAHEKKITGNINNLVNLAQKANDNPALIMLQWFVNEQVEEEKNALQILETLKIIKEQGPALIMLDRELGKREG